MKITEGYIPFMKYKTYYRIAGEQNPKKKPLILLHGGPGSTHNYFEVLDHVAEEDGRELITYDQIGCGKSYLDGHPELWKSDTWVRELMAVREYLGLDECHILGQSWGGMLTLEYICNYPHSGVKSIILSSTLSSSKLWGEEQMRMIKEMPPEMQEAIAKAQSSGNYEDPDYLLAEEEFMHRHCSDKPGEGAPECLTREKKTGREAYVTAWGPNEFTPLGTLKDYDVTAQLKDIREPALIISGGNDLCTPYQAKIMFDNIPDSRWELFQYCRHSCYVEENERYSALLKEWLNEHD